MITLILIALFSTLTGSLAYWIGWEKGNLIGFNKSIDIAEYWRKRSDKWRDKYHDSRDREYMPEQDNDDWWKRGEKPPWSQN